MKKFFLALVFSTITVSFCPIFGMNKYYDRENLSSLGFKNYTDDRTGISYACADCIEIIKDMYYAQMHLTNECPAITQIFRSFRPNNQVVLLNRLLTYIHLNDLEIIFPVEILLLHLSKDGL